MSNFSEFTEAWLQMAEEVIGFARQRKSKDDYLHYCGMQPPTQLKNYSIRETIANKLIEEGIIKIADKRLDIGGINRSEWVEQGLKDGKANIWKLAEAIQPNAHIFKKFESDKLSDIGNKGEKYVIEKLKAIIPCNLHNSIELVSEYNDTLGYDICTPSTVSLDRKIFLEVKTTVRQQEQFNLFLSKNEYKVSQRHTNWYLILVKISDGVPLIVGHIAGTAISGLMPVNHFVGVSWETASIKVDPDWIRPNIP